MELVGRDADFRAESEFATVGKTSGDIVENTGGVDLAEKALGSGFITGDDGVGVVRAECVDVGDGLVEGIDDLYGQDEVEVLGAPVLVGGGGNIN